MFPAILEKCDRFFVSFLFSIFTLKCLKGIHSPFPRMSANRRTYNLGEVLDIFDKDFDIPQNGNCFPRCRIFSWTRRHGVPKLSAFCTIDASMQMPTCNKKATSWDAPLGGSRLSLNSGIAGVSYGSFVQSSAANGNCLTYLLLFPPHRFLQVRTFLQ